MKTLPIETGRPHATHAHTIRVIVLTVGGALMAMPSAASAQCDLAGAWWRSPSVGQRLGLTAEQRSKIDASYEAARPRLRELQTTLADQQRRLDRAMNETEVSRTDVDRGIEAVERARTALSKARAHMLLDMRQALTLSQRERLTELASRGCEPRSSGSARTPADARPRNPRRPR